MANFFDAFQQGREDDRRNRAYHALRMAYGDEAGDPGAAAQLQALDQNRQLFPLKLQQEQAEIDMLPDKRRQVQAATRSAEASADLSDDRVAAAQNARRLGALLNAAQYVQSEIDRKGDPLKAFDHVAPFLDLQPEQVQQMRQAIQENPAEVKSFIDAQRKLPTTGAGGAGRFQFLTDDKGNIFRGTATGAEPVLGADGRQLRSGTFSQAEDRNTTANRRIATTSDLAQPEFKGSQEEAKALGKERGKIAAEDLTPSKSAQAAKSAQLETARADLDAGVEDIDAAIEQVSPLSSGIGALAEFVPGSAAADLAERVSTVASRVLLDQIAKMKSLSKTGSTGLGALSDTEGRLLMSLQGSLKTRQSPKQLLSNLRTIRKRMQESFARFEKAYRNDKVAKGVEEPEEELSDDALLQLYGGE